MEVLHTLLCCRCKTFVYQLDLIFTEFSTNGETRDKTGYDKSADDCVECEGVCGIHFFLFC